MWEIQILWNEIWVTVQTGFKSRDDAEWATGLWKQKNKCTGDPFRVVEYKNTGTLRKKENGRWSIFADISTELSELSSGSTVEVNIGTHWIITGIEHSRDYYATTKGIHLYNGIPARQRSTR